MVQRVKTTVLHFLFPICPIVPYCCLLLSFVLKSWGDGALSSGVLRAFFRCSSSFLQVFFGCSSGAMGDLGDLWVFFGCSSNVFRVIPVVTIMQNQFQIPVVQ